MVIMRFLMVSLLLLSFACKKKAMDPLSVSYQRLQAVPQQKWDALARKKVFFGHQSVGLNIMDGLGRVLASTPAIGIDLRETADPADFEAPVFAHSRIGRNRDPKGKIDHFRQLLESGIGRSADVALFKLCYVDIDQTADIESIIDHYDRTVADLREEFPNLVIIPVTAPLTNATPGLKAKIKRLLGRGPAIKADNIKRNAFNDHMRKAYGTALWDLADAEATAADGTKTAFRDRRGSFFLLYPGYTIDGGHLNEVGSQVIAIDLLLRLASLDPR